MICLSETYLDSSFADDELRLTSKASLLLEKIIPIIIREVKLAHLAVHPVSALNLNEHLVLKIKI